MNVDLHTHSDCSDGTLTPLQLLAAAREAGVDLMAVTDHDTLAAYDALSPGANGSVHLVSGIELSTRWRRMGVHIVGLDLDLEDTNLLAGIAAQRAAREERAQRIAARLARLGFADTLEGARRVADGAQIGRPHFARHLVETGAVRDMREAFKKYLGNGKAGDVRGEWISLDEAVRWIRNAGGHAVLAHPAKYRLTRTKLSELTAEFAAAGGDTIEVVSGRQTPDVTDSLAQLAERHALHASCGSDFHSDGAHWARLGSCPPLPARCTPVWQDW